jgi:hypothetical protein
MVVEEIFQQRGSIKPLICKNLRISGSTSKAGGGGEGGLSLSIDRETSLLTDRAVKGRINGVQNVELFNRYQDR